MATTIYHNPACGTSRNTLAIIRQSGDEPEIIEYLHNPPSRQRIVELANAMGVPVRALLRRKGTPYEELGLDNPQLDDAALLDAVERHPVLLERPVVVTSKGTRLCRPSEKVLDILERPLTASFTREDGSVVMPAGAGQPG